MSTATSSPEASAAGRTLPLTEGSLLQRLLRGALTPGGAVFILLAALSSPSSGSTRPSASRRS